MTDMTMTRLQEVMVIIYAISLVFYFIDYWKKNRRLYRYAFWGVSLVWVLQSIFLALYIFETHRFPVLSLFEGIYFYAWLLVAISIAMHCIFKLDLPVILINVVGFCFVVVHTFAPNELAPSPVSEALVSELLVIHIVFAIMSYGAFTIGFVFAMLYLVLHNVLKSKKWPKQFSRLPSLAQAESGMSYSLYCGVSLLGVSLILGVVWAYIALPDFTFWDIKIFGSFISLFVYSIIIYKKQKGKLYATKYAWANVYAFLFILINFFIGSRFSAFHFWY